MADIIPVLGGSNFASSLGSIISAAGNVGRLESPIQGMMDRTKIEEGMGQTGLAGAETQKIIQGITQQKRDQDILGKVWGPGAASLSPSTGSAPVTSGDTQGAAALSSATGPAPVTRGSGGQPAASLGSANPYMTAAGALATGGGSPDAVSKYFAAGLDYEKVQQAKTQKEAEEEKAVFSEANATNNPATAARIVNANPMLVNKYGTFEVKDFQKTKIVGNAKAGWWDVSEEGEPKQIVAPGGDPDEISSRVTVNARGVPVYARKDGTPSTTIAYQKPEKPEKPDWVIKNEEGNTTTFYNKHNPKETMTVEGKVTGKPSASQSKEDKAKKALGITDKGNMTGTIKGNKITVNGKEYDVKDGVVTINGKKYRVTQK